MGDWAQPNKHFEFGFEKSDSKIASWYQLALLAATLTIEKLLDIVELTCVCTVATLESDLHFLLGCGEKRHQSKVRHNPILRQTHLHPRG